MSEQKPKLIDGRCPSCGYVFDCATNLDNMTATPKIGDISFCIKCGTVSQFDKFGVKAIDVSKLDGEIKTEIQRIRKAWFKTRGSEYAS